MTPSAPDKRFMMTDRQWADVVTSLRPLKLPPEARTSLEQEITHYIHAAKTWSKPANEVSESLAQAGGAAKKLAELLEALSQQEILELIEARSLVKSDVRFLPLREMIAHAKILHEACALAPEQLSLSSLPSHRSDFIRNLDDLLLRFAGQRVCRSKPVVDFLEKVCRMANDDIGRSGIVSAIRRLQTSGEFPAKKSRKNAARISRRRAGVR